MQDALQALPWVKQVKVNFDKKQAVVTADKARYDEKALLKALENAGYGGKVVK